MVEALVQNHKIGLQHGVVIFDADGNIVSTFGGSGSGLTDAQLRAAAVPVSTASGDAGLVELATAIAGASPKTLADLFAKDFATQTTLAAILAKIIAAPATEAKQDTQITAEQAILAKLTADPATQTTLAAVLAKIIAAPATEAKQPALGTALTPSADALTVQRPAVTQVVSTALEASKVLKASAGQLVQLSVFNSGPAQFLLLMNSTAVPADGAVTLLFPPIPIPAATLLVLDLPAPIVASTGIAISNSTTGSFTKTLGAADLAIYAQVN